MGNINSSIPLAVGYGVKITIRPAHDGQMSAHVATLELLPDEAAQPERKPAPARRGKRKGGTQP